MKYFILFLLLVLNISTIQSQKLPQAFSLIPSGWFRIKLSNCCHFDIPPTMEIQKGKYKENVDLLKSLIGIETSEIVVQQKGLNEFDSKGFQRYARIMFDTEYGNSGDYERLNFNISNITQSDKKDLDQMLNDATIKSGYKIEMKIINWYPLKIEKINGMSCIHICYTRQIKTNPIVLVNTYVFQNVDRKYTFTLSYRLSEENYWKTDLDKVLKSFRITNIKK